jgi:hypothetical protein
MHTTYNVGMKLEITSQNITQDEAQRIGEEYIADYLGDQIGADLPRRIVSSLRSAWVVPLVLTSPGYGKVGTVGLIVVDEENGHISAWTTTEEVEENARHLIEEMEDELQVAFANTAYALFKNRTRINTDTAE